MSSKFLNRIGSQEALKRIILVLIIAYYSINLIKKFKGVAYAFPDGRGFGGNTTTAEVGRKVFHSEALRKRLVDLVPVVYRPALSMVLFNNLILLRLMSCDYVLLPSKIGRFVYSVFWG